MSFLCFLWIGLHFHWCKTFYCLPINPTFPTPTWQLPSAFPASRSWPRNRSHVILLAGKCTLIYFLFLPSSQFAYIPEMAAAAVCACARSCLRYSPLHAFFLQGWCALPRRDLSVNRVKQAPGRRVKCKIVQALFADGCRKWKWYPSPLPLNIKPTVMKSQGSSFLRMLSYYYPSGGEFAEKWVALLGKSALGCSVEVSELAVCQ